MLDIAFIAGWILFSLISGVTVQLIAEDSDWDWVERFLGAIFCIVAGGIWFIVVPLFMGAGLLIFIAHKLKVWSDTWQ